MVRRYACALFALFYWFCEFTASSHFNFLVLRTLATKYFPRWNLFKTLQTVCFKHGLSIYEIKSICHHAQIFITSHGIFQHLTKPKSYRPLARYGLPPPPWKLWRLYFFRAAQCLARIYQHVSPLAKAVSYQASSSSHNIQRFKEFFTYNLLILIRFILQAICNM